jgi:hypothetical protein
MSALTNRQRKKIELFLMQQERLRSDVRVSTATYTRKYPSNDTETNMLVGNIVGNTRPNDVWITRHALERPDALTVEEIMDTIRRGVYLQDRNAYRNTKYGRPATNRGKIAPKLNSRDCPKRRLSTGDKTVVLAFCYPRDFHRKLFLPIVVTAYRE